MSFFRFRGVLCVMAVLCSYATFATATSINIDINGSTGLTYTGTAPGAAGAWNGYANGDGWSDPAKSGPLFDSAGNGTTVTFDMGTSIGGSTSGGAAGSPLNVANTLMDDGAYMPGGTQVSFAIEGLVASAKYNLCFYWFGGNNPTMPTNYVVDGVGTQLATSGFTDAEGFVLGKNYVVFEGVAADGLGKITGNFHGDNGNYGTLAGLAITSVPEPSTLLLTAVGMVSLLVYAWRRRG